jgi:hypothetical protein
MFSVMEIKKLRWKKFQSIFKIKHNQKGKCVMFMDKM